MLLDAPGYRDASAERSSHDDERTGPTTRSASQETVHFPVAVAAAITTTTTTATTTTTTANARQEEEISIDMGRSSSPYNDHDDHQMSREKSVRIPKLLQLWIRLVLFLDGH